MRAEQWIAVIIITPPPASYLCLQWGRWRGGRVMGGSADSGFSAKILGRAARSGRGSSQENLVL